MNISCLNASSDYVGNSVHELKIEKMTELISCIYVHLTFAVLANTLE